VFNCSYPLLILMACPIVMRYSTAELTRVTFPSLMKVKPSKQFQGPFVLTAAYSLANKSYHLLVLDVLRTFPRK